MLRIIIDFLKTNYLQILYLDHEKMHFLSFDLSERIFLKSFYLLKLNCQDILQSILNHRIRSFDFVHKKKRI